MSLDQRGTENDPLTFTLIDKTPGSDLRIVIQAPSEDVKQNWVTQIRSILDMQGDFLKGMRAPHTHKHTHTHTHTMIVKLNGNSMEDECSKKLVL